MTVLERQLARVGGGWATLADGSAIVWRHRVTWVPRAWCEALVGGHLSTSTERWEIITELRRLTGMKTEIKQWRPGVPSPLMTACDRCGRLLEVDWIVDDRLWKKIDGPGVRCLRCAAAEVGVEALIDGLQRVYVALDGMTLELTVTTVHAGVPR